MPRLLPACLALALSTGFALSISAQSPPPQNVPVDKSVPPTNQAKPAVPAPRQRFGGAGGDYKQYSQETLDSGKKIYTANCAFCHGGSAKGGETGPDLLRSVVVLHDEEGEGLSAFIHVGRPEKGMPAFKLPDDQVKDIAAFLHDRVRAAAERGGYQILNIVVGDAKAGEAYFNGAGNCATCHSVTKDLAHVGTKFDPVALQQKIVMPREFSYGPRAAAVAAGTAVMVNVTQPDGQVAEGVLQHLDDFSVTLTDKAGNRNKFPRESVDVPKIELHDPLKAHTELLSRYTDSDIHNLTAYLVTIK
jgi:cytochrome c oxidase cbb3-type subunit III